MMWDLPISVEICGKKHPIRNGCDYRVVLDVISALNDEELDVQHRIECALFIFYGNENNLNSVQDVISELKDIQTATTEMMKIINLGEDVKQEEHKPQLMDWEHDFSQIAPPISRVLGYSVRALDRYTHWYDFIGAYMEIGGCSFSTIVSIRNKRLKGKKLEKWEQDFYKENRNKVDLPRKFTVEEQEFLDSDW